MSGSYFDPIVNNLAVINLEKSIHYQSQWKLHCRQVNIGAIGTHRIASTDGCEAGSE